MPAAGKSLELIQDCPICGAKRITFDVLESSFIPGEKFKTVLFCRCRSCLGCSNFIFESSSVDFFDTPHLKGIVVNDFSYGIELDRPRFSTARSCPDYCPTDVQMAFGEATVCMSVAAWNAAGAMLRKTIDLATKTLVREDESNKIGQSGFISWKDYKDLRLRINWLLKNSLLDVRLEPLIDCIREDGNDAAHSSENLDQYACLDMLDFATSILEAIFTEPGRIAESIRRRTERRGK